MHAEVVATTADRVRVMPYGPLTGVAAGAPARAVRARCWCRPAAGCSAASSTPSAVRSTARARSRPTASCRSATARPTRCAARASWQPLGLGVRVLDTMVDGRSRAAPRPVRRLRRRQVVTAVDDRARDGRAGVRHRTGGGARPRGARVPRRRPGCGRPGALGRGGGDLRRAGRHAAPRGLRRDPDRRGLPRRGRRRGADDGLAHPRRHGAARDRAVGGRAAGDPRLSAVDVLAAGAAARARGHRRDRVDHRALHGAGGRRRPQRADRRRCALHPRRSRRARPAARGRRALPLRRRARLGLRGSRRG